MFVRVGGVPQPVELIVRIRAHKMGYDRLDRFWKSRVRHYRHLRKMLRRRSGLDARLGWPDVGDPWGNPSRPDGIGRLRRPGSVTLLPRFFRLGEEMRYPRQCLGAMPVGHGAEGRPRDIVRNPVLLNVEKHE